MTQRSPRSFRLRFGVIVFCAAFVLLHALTTAAIDAQPDRPPRPPDGEYDFVGDVTDVIIFRDRAAVTRRVEAQLDPGRYLIRIIDLPESVRPESLRAFVSAGATINSVEYAMVRNARLFNVEQPERQRQRQELDARILELERERQVLEKEGEMLDSIAERTATETGSGVGGGRVDLDEITRISEYLSQRRRELITQEQELTANLDDLRAQLNESDALWAQRVADEGEVGAAVISLSVSDLAESTVALDLSYLVAQSSWIPHYTIRADPDNVRVHLDFEALVTQKTGEDWTDARILLSTGEAVVPTTPPSLNPTFIDVVSPRSQPDSNKALAGVVGRGDDVDNRFGDWLTSYRLPAPVTIRSHTPEPERLRILTLTSRTTYRYVAAPRLAEHAFLRGVVTNTSRAHLLPGAAGVYFGGEYAGISNVPQVAPDESFDVYFGVDRRVTLRRLVVDQERRTTGLLGDGREIKSRVQIQIRNDTGHDVRLELWDRVPVSRDDRIRVSVTKLTQSLSDDEEYKDEGRRRGLLRWDIVLSATGSSRQQTIEYTLVVNHKKDVTPTGFDP